MSISEDDSDLSLGSFFTEPPRPPSPTPTITIYNRDPHHWASKNRSEDLTEDWNHINIRLVGTHPLWGHYLWNAARSFANYLDEHPQLYRDRSVLEFGAGGGLPGIVAAKNGAKKVVLTDYPDSILIDNLEFNVMNNIAPDTTGRVSVMGYLWGHPTQPLIDLLPKSPAPISKQGFDLIILSDLIFNHSQHDALLKSCEDALKPCSPTQLEAPTVLVFYTHHRPHLAHRDLEFFTKATERRWICEEIVKDKFPPMFPEDPGAEEVRSTVHGWRLTRAPYSL